jgi:hypothetical protein
MFTDVSQWFWKKNFQYNTNTCQLFICTFQKWILATNNGCKVRINPILAFGIQILQAYCQCIGLSVDWLLLFLFPVLKGLCLNFFISLWIHEGTLVSLTIFDVSAYRPIYFVPLYKTKIFLNFSLKHSSLFSWQFDSSFLRGRMTCQACNSTTIQEK